MGPMPVPADALYGAQTARAVRNFPISGQRMPRPALRALGLVKKHAARTNGALGLLDPDLAEALAAAAAEVAEGRWDTEFPVDIYQTGSGTSTNMNANEVLARLAARRLHGRTVHPNDHANLGQSSNDVMPTVLHLAALEEIHARLRPALAALHAALDEKARTFHGVLKIGRTHLQDATPIRLGHEFSGYARQVELGLQRLALLDGDLGELALGGTAVGTGINAHPEFARRVIAGLAEETGLPLREAANHFEAQSARDAAVQASAALRTLALGLHKIAGDLRLLASGPRCGLGEIRLPATQPGSSIMPGKVNPVMCEMLAMVCARVLGNDATIAFAGAGGHFELNANIPVILHALLESIHLLANGASSFTERCVHGLEADAARCTEAIEQSLALATALVPAMGYDRAVDLAREAHASGKTIRTVALERSGLPPEEIARLLDPASQAGA